MLQLVQDEERHGKKSKADTKGKGKAVVKAKGKGKAVEFKADEGADDVSVVCSLQAPLIRSQLIVIDDEDEEGKDHKTSKSKSEASSGQNEKQKKSGTSKRLIGEDSQRVKEILKTQPMKGFLLRAQQEFRVYLALENAWPRSMRKGLVEKHVAPTEIIKQTCKKYSVYDTKAFRSTFNELWKQEGAKDMIVRYVRGSVSLLFQSLHRYPSIGVQGGCPAPARGQAEGEARGREGIPNLQSKWWRKQAEEGYGSAYQLPEERWRIPPREPGHPFVGN